MKLTITPLIASTFLSDGGTMFGLVPKALWSRLIPPDEKNRIQQNLNTLLIQWPNGRKALLDIGCGAPEKFSQKERHINGINDYPLIHALHQLNTSPNDITDLLLTHLHWDHIGAAIQPDGSPTFPNATLHTHPEEWEDAHAQNPLHYKAYPNNVIDPLASHYPTQHHNPPPGIQFIQTGGHTRGHCAIHIQGDLTLNHPQAHTLHPLTDILYTGDAIPTQHHLRMVFHPAYDLYPLQTRAWKKDHLPTLSKNKTLLIFPHDPTLFGATLKPHPKHEFQIHTPLPTNSQHK